MAIERLHQGATISIECLHQGAAISIKHLHQGETISIECLHREATISIECQHSAMFNEKILLNLICCQNRDTCYSLCIVGFFNIFVDSQCKIS